MTSGITKAEENTGPMNPTDCATTSGSERTFAPRRSYALRDPAIEPSLLLRYASFTGCRLRGCCLRGTRDADGQLAQPVGEVGADPLRWSGQLEPSYAAGQRGEHDPDLEPGQVRAQAQVRAAAAEAEVPVRGPADIERVRVLELGFVTVPGHVPEDDLVAFPDVRAAHFGVGGGGAAHEVGGAGPADDLVGGWACEGVRVCGQAVPLVLVLDEG